MTKFKHLFAGLTITLASWLTANSAFALNDHSWVSSTGVDGNTCARDAPCRTFLAAHAATNAGGVISVLDSTDYGNVTITKSITIRAEGVDGGAVTIGGGSWIDVFGAGPSAVVTIEGLHLNGASGIRTNTGAHLHVVRCVFANGTLSGAAGISFRPLVPSKLSVTDTVINNFGSGTGGGIVINPQFGGTAQVNLERVTVNGNAFGIAADGTGSGGINMTIADSMVGGNSQDGIIAVTPSGGGPIGVMVTNTKSVNNAFGVRSIGPNVTVRVKNSDVTGNNTGLSFSGGGALLTYGNNAVQANGVDGAFSGPVPLQ